MFCIVSKKVLSLLISICLVFSITQITFALEGQKIVIDGEEITYTGNPMTVEGNAVLLPAKVILEKIGMKLEWDAQNKILKGYKEGTSIVVFVDKNLMLYQGKEVQLTRGVPRLINGSVMITDEILQKCFVYAVNVRNGQPNVYYEPLAIVDPYVKSPEFVSNVPPTVYAKFFPNESIS